MKRQQQQAQVINHEAFGHLEVLMEGDKAFFPATEVAQVLGYSNPHDALNKHCLDPGLAFREVGVRTGTKADGTPAIKMIQKKYISEGNLYRLIVRSKLPQAIEFEHWVFDEVLPEIRKNGMYITMETAIEAVEDEATFLSKALKIADKKLQRLQVQLEEARPAQEFVAQFVEAPELFTLRETAKILAVRERTFIQTLMSQGYLYRINNGRLLPHQKHLVEKGFAELRLGTSPFSGHAFHQTVFTSRGVEWLTRLLKKVS